MESAGRIQRVAILFERRRSRALSPRSSDACSTAFLMIRSSTSVRFHHMGHLPKLRSSQRAGRPRKMKVRNSRCGTRFQTVRSARVDRDVPGSDRLHDDELTAIVRGSWQRHRLAFQQHPSPTRDPLAPAGRSPCVVCGRRPRSSRARGPALSTLALDIGPRWRGQPRLLGRWR